MRERERTVGGISEKGEKGKGELILKNYCF